MVHRVATAQELLHVQNGKTLGHDRSTGEKMMTSPEIRRDLFDLERIFFWVLRETECSRRRAMLGVNWRVGITSKILGGPAFLAENCLNSCMMEHERAIFPPVAEPSTLGRLYERGDLGSTRSRAFLPKKYLESDITEYLEKQQYTKGPSPRPLHNFLNCVLPASQGAICFLVSEGQTSQQGDRG